MATYYSPKIVTDGLVFCLDAASRNGISALGCGGFNGAPQLVKNMASPSDVITDAGGVRLGNLTYYTAFAIDYPEGSYGGDAAGRHGITPGYNVRSGGKTYTTGRALHLYAWNNVTNAWIEGEFTGTYGSGHQYDNYTGSEVGYANELAKFVTDYNNIKTKYADVTFIVIGSHRADRYTQAVRDILTDLGKPAGYIDSDYIAAPEWILIGKPGLGAGNYYGWAYENYTTDPSFVAHLNFGLPLFGSKDNYFIFDGVDDYISAGNLGAQFSNYTVEICFKSDNVANYRNPIDCNWLVYNGSYSNIGPRLEQNNSGNLVWVVGDTSGNYESRTVISSGMSATPIHCASITKSGNLVTSYYNGAQVQSGNQTYTHSGSFGNVQIGRGFSTSAERWFNGRVYSVKIYNKALTTAEILSNYNATKGRFGL